MYIAQAFRCHHELWRYIIGVVIIMIAVFMAQIPFLIALFLEGGFDAAMDETAVLKVFDSNLTLFFLLLPFAAGLVAVFFNAKYLHSQPLKTLTTTRKKLDWSRFFFAFTLVAIFTILTTLGYYFFYPEDYQLNFEPTSFLILVGIAVIFIPLQTSFEEYMFRGYLMQGLGVFAKNRWVPLFLTSIIFGGLHYFNPEVGQLGDIIMIHYIGTGFMLGIMTLMDEGLELALGFHAANNLVAALLVTADWTAFQTESIFKDVSAPIAGFWDVAIPVFIIYPLFLFIMAKKYGWNNWKNKLFGKVEKPETLKLSEES
ncbi:hypothetical protein SAMN04488033_13337 [Salegentibacter agarivorans]|uniref:CAAX prenyl protease 2/Lysostaphin resistance protein A-like domain-containing protein n=1 Tax=Salegentibacter agarivorans TaxID=345907 RepID=A0A1I2PTH1_9FLAO|nr:MULTISPECIES: CPBP family intramembrane glutamic endopeptidase [Salegentibacter]APS38903.1 abortive phage infection protein [Salegentibacter sp. T436]SFG17307.1 hypothetical protein SAMN04488033_13337 [Salegentibacter agarivorans]